MTESIQESGAEVVAPMLTYGTGQDGKNGSCRSAWFGEEVIIPLDFVEMDLMNETVISNKS